MKLSEQCPKAYRRTGGWKKLPELLMTQRTLSPTADVGLCCPKLNFLATTAATSISATSAPESRLHNKNCHPQKLDASAAVLTSTTGSTFLTLLAFRLNSHMNKSNWWRLDHMCVPWLQRILENVLYLD